MGLPSLTLDAELAATWRAVLEKNGVNVCRDEAEGEKVEAFKALFMNQEESASKRISEAAWRVRDADAELRILEAKYLDRHDGSVHLIFMPFGTPIEQQLFLLVQKVLVASGATVGTNKESKTNGPSCGAWPPAMEYRSRNGVK